jgi:phosphoserine aminotransferase
MNTQTFFTVGPAAIHPNYAIFYNEALQENIGSISHRSEVFRKIYQHTDASLKKLLQIPETHAILFGASASELWERIILNTVAYKSAHFVNGAFAKKFYDYAKACGKQTQLIEADFGAHFNLDAVKIDKDVELICTTQNETSTGVKWSAQELKSIKQKYPNTLLCTDIVSSAPLQDVDFEFMDMAFFSVQKVFGMPAGLGVWIVNKSILEKTKSIQAQDIGIGAHQTLLAYLSNYQNWETPSTPNVMAIYCLGKISEWYNQNNFKLVKNNLENRLNNLYDSIAKSTTLSPFVAEANNRSTTVAVLKTTISSKSIITQAKEIGLVLGSGYGNYKEQNIRIGNFPAVSDYDWNRMTDFLKTV